MRSKEGSIYTILILMGNTDISNLGDIMIVSCTNKRSVSHISGIPYDRIVYMFTRKGRTYLYSKEHDCIILKSSTLYKGRQKGGKSKKGYNGFNRNK